MESENKTASRLAAAILIGFAALVGVTCGLGGAAAVILFR